MRFTNDDILKRENFARKLIRLLDNSEIYSKNNNLVMALNAPWGTGKSTFINKFSNLIQDEQNDKYGIFVYNSWDDDSFYTPLIPIINALVKSFPEEDVNESSKRELLNVASKLGKLLVKGIGKKVLVDKLGVDNHDLRDFIENDLNIELKDVKDVIAKDEDTEIQIHFKEYQLLKEHFQNLIKKIALNKKLVFVIDELDRCRPTYAIEVLEVIKHYFEIENVIFIIALDIEQLSHSIATVYGQNMDSTGYLMRFFNLNIRLPIPNIKNYIELVFDNYELSYDENINVINEMFTKLDCSLRDIERITLNYRILTDTLFGKIKSTEQEHVYMYMIVLKYKYPKIFNMILFEKFTYGNIQVDSEQEYLPDKYYEFDDDIFNSIVELSNGGNVDECTDDSVFIFKEDINAFMNGVTLGKYIEGKLELFDGIDF